MEIAFPSLQRVSIAGAIAVASLSMHAAAGGDPCDCNGDGTTDIQDLLVLLGFYCEEEFTCDQNGDNFIDEQDLALFVECATFLRDDPIGGQFGVRLVRSGDACDAPMIAPLQTSDGGAFYQDPVIDLEVPPDPAFIGAFPDLVFDSYVPLGGMRQTQTDDALEATIIPAMGVPQLFSPANEVNGVWFALDQAPPDVSVGLSEINPFSGLEGVFIANLTVTENTTIMGGVKAWVVDDSGAFAELSLLLGGSPVVHNGQIYRLNAYLADQRVISSVAYDNYVLYVERAGLPPCTSSDLNGNGSVGSEDLAELIGNWGPCDPGD